MLFSPRLPLKPLASLCRRLATALSAGVDARTIWAREAEHAQGMACRRHLAHISDSVNQGGSVAAAMCDAGDYFPSLVREMVDVGEQSGHLAEVFDQLADHYQHQMQLRRAFFSAIAWPMTELTLAVVIVGILIWAMGFIGEMTGMTIDILGLGLVGTRGLEAYSAGVFIVVFLLWLAIRAARRGAIWVAPVQRLVLQVPVLGPALQTVALSQLAWSMHLTMKTGMEVRRAMRLSLRSTRSARYLDQIRPIEASISEGNSIYESFRSAGCFPPDFLDSLHTGEHSGRLVESMELLSTQYQEQARAALATLTMLAGFAVWMVVAGIIISVIFRIFMFYLGVLNGAMPK
jgi:type IV pilus assembly protein PilC